MLDIFGSIIITNQHVVGSSDDRYLFARFRLSPPCDYKYLYVSLFKKNENAKMKKFFKFEAPTVDSSPEHQLDYHVYVLCKRTSEEEGPHIEDIPGICVDEEHEFPTQGLFVVHCPDAIAPAMVSELPFAVLNFNQEPQNMQDEMRNINNEDLRLVLNYSSTGTISGSSGGLLVHENRVIGIHRASGAGIFIKSVIEDLVRRNHDNDHPVLRWNGNPFRITYGRDTNGQGGRSLRVKLPERPKFENLKKQKEEANKQLSEMAKARSCHIFPQAQEVNRGEGNEQRMMGMENMLTSIANQMQQFQPRNDTVISFTITQRDLIVISATLVSAALIFYLATKRR
uniref:Uncharacterized protein n=1 Tax=Vannella robusta TaxID=1487602 RepID=A0A7S4HJH4_9EUKA|mmetsp:Transcript_11523/g.14278  ORF Transcript_11523/g.14278 Transcript_11523/m.14278 type:complete len:341 (+) Transcript_11523:264-1286(+)